MAQPQSLHPDIREADIVRLQLNELPAAQRIHVVRPLNADPKVETPEYMWIIPQSDNALLPFTEPVMVRQEYYNVITAILWSLYRQSQVAPLKNQFPPTQDEQMDVDSGAKENVDSSAEEDVAEEDVAEEDVAEEDVAEENVESRSEEDVASGAEKESSAEEDSAENAEDSSEEDSAEEHIPLRTPLRIPLRIPNNTPIVSENATLPNPFKHSRRGHFYRRDSAVIITGLPGIGKTLLLSVIFYLRVAAGLPTVFMRAADFMLVYSGHPSQQLFVLRDLISLQRAVSKGAWILLDSDRTFFTPPETLVRTGFFIVQAASPRAGRMDWAEKIRGPYQFCLMQPWTLEELFAASSLQPGDCSGDNMQAFFEKFGGSARHVYKESHDVAAFDHRVLIAALSLKKEKIHRLLQVMTYPSPTVAIPDEIGHMLITALPLNDKDRTQHQMKWPTPHLEKKLLKAIDDRYTIARRELYIINVGIKSPGCRATAAHLLDKHHHGFIGLGGKWRLREFEEPNGAHTTSTTNSWRVSKKKSNVFLVADGTMKFSRERRKTPATTDFQGLTMVDFPSANIKELQSDYFYRPSDANFTTFDSFYIDKKGHAITFQTTESDKSHTVKAGGREWLEERGITKFTYILVTGPKMGDPPSLSVPRNQKEKFDHFFHLVLDYPELKKLLWSTA
ncbi:hypothetical protein GGX14DRAFT_663393 [Mycena pura]|uniref:Uncharacterized protein n=1 Tax=Mycena pura TaxID=153505 RepID=A0AAD6YKU4_9AGAR|nr:hypothetical protein GGX14DRAFT_663393 [Mycena pura]